MPKAKLKDVSIYYEIYGAGEPLLLIAGLGSDVSSWLSVVRQFAAHFKTIIFDNRGCGRSKALRNKCTIGCMAKDVVGLLDFLKIEKAHILGHSMGGYIAQELAAKYPKRVDKLVLESTAPVSSDRNNVLLEDFYVQLKSEGVSQEWIKRWAFWLFSPKLFSDKSFIDTFIRNASQYPYAQKAQCFKGQIEAIASFNAVNKISAIKAKTLIIEGKNDILITPEEAMLLAKNIKGSAFKLLDGVAHCIHIENPKLFTEVVLKFLGRS